MRRHVSFLQKRDHWIFPFLNRLEIVKSGINATLYYVVSYPVGTMSLTATVSSPAPSTRHIHTLLSRITCRKAPQILLVNICVTDSVRKYDNQDMIQTVAGPLKKKSVVIESERKRKGQGFWYVLLQYPPSEITFTNNIKRRPFTLVSPPDLINLSPHQPHHIHSCLTSNLSPITSIHHYRFY